MNSRILAVIPGKAASWAYFIRNGEALTACGVIDGDSVPLVQQVVATQTANILVVEKRRPGESEDIETILRQQHIWEITGEGRGLRVDPVDPSTWQAYFGIEPGDKEAMIERASAAVGRVVRVDEAPAILLGKFWMGASRGQPFLPVGS